MIATQDATPPEWFISPPQANPSQRARFGKPTIQNRTEMMPTGDALISEARKAFWEAWQIGLQKSGNSFYPRLPLLDREPMEPEI